jgi:5-methylcytosine-specific restriction endonuclease McrA
MERTCWAGSRAAQIEHGAALNAHPIKLKPKKKKWNKQSKKNKKRKKLPRPKEPIKITSYGAYLNSEWWKYKRLQKLHSVGFKCHRCNEICDLQVHHLHYLSLGREKNRDLEVLCRKCHQWEHRHIIAARQAQSKKDKEKNKQFSMTPKG